MFASAAGVALAIVKCFFLDYLVSTQPHVPFYHNNFGLCWKGQLSGWRVGRQMEATEIRSVDFICHKASFILYSLCLHRQAVCCEASFVMCKYLKKKQVWWIMLITSQTRLHFLKCYYLASMHLPFYLLRAAFWFIIKELCIIGSQQFSQLQSHYIYRARKINWRHATVRTGAWARAE